jgi:hypothetical protein
VPRLFFTPQLARFTAVAQGNFVGDRVTMLPPIFAVRFG